MPGMLIGSRLKERLEVCGVSQARLAREIGVTPQAISKMVLGETTDTAKIYQIASFLHTTPEYLTGDSDDPGGAAVVADRQHPWHGPRSEEPSDDQVGIAVSDVAYGLGGAFVDDSSTSTTIERFPRSFIRQFTKGPVSQLYFATSIGDSMQPTIHHSDLVLIDRSQEMLRVSDQLWALHAGSIAMIKRVRVMPDGDVLLVSDNPDVSDYRLGENELQLIGRVVAVVKRV